MDPNYELPITDLSAGPSAKADYRLRRRRSRAAFTLMELMVATAFTVLIVVMLGWMLGSLMGSTSHATARVDAFRDARAALQMMERDLRNIVRTQWSPDPFTGPSLGPCATATISTTPVTLPAAYFALDNIWRPGPNDPPDPFASTNPNANAQIFALISEKTTASSGDVCAVGYYCRWDGRAYSLRRFFRPLTVSAMQGFGSYAGESALYTPGSSDPVLAAYVWNLRITLYDAAGTQYTTYPCVCDRGAVTPVWLPAAVEISFNAMSPQAAQAMMSVSSSPNDWMDTTTQNYQRLIAPHAYQFRSRINLP